MKDEHRVIVILLGRNITPDLNNCAENVYGICWSCMLSSSKELARAQAEP
jgi:hypothetical protein